MRASVTRLNQSTRSRIRILATPRIHYTPIRTTFCPSHRHQNDPGNLGDQTPYIQQLHTTSPSSRLGRPRWLKRGMRGRIRAWAGSLGLTDGQESGPETDEPLGEELYVMPGWAVAKGRDGKGDDMAQSKTLDASIGELGFSSVRRRSFQCHSTFMYRSLATAPWLVQRVERPAHNVSWSLLFVVSLQ